MSKNGWRNRVIDRKRMRVGDLQVNRYNPRSHPAVQQQRLEAVLEKFGAITELIGYYSERNGGALTLFDGHARQKLDTDIEWDVAITDLTDTEVDELVLYFDPLAALARQEADKTMALMAGLNVQERALLEMLEEQAANLFVDFAIPNPEPQQEPSLASEHFIEIYCNHQDLEAFRPTLAEWSKREDVTVNIS